LSLFLLLRFFDRDGELCVHFKTIVLIALAPTLFRIHARPRRRTFPRLDNPRIGDDMPATVLAEAGFGLPKLYWEASPNFSPTVYKNEPSLIVIHDCEGSYHGSVSWFASLRSHVSAHFVVSEDGSEVTQTVPLSKKAWAQCFYNAYRGAPAISIEMGGYESKGFGPAEWAMVARMTGYFCHRYKIPVQASKGDRPGIARHYDLGIKGGGHKDPTLDSTTWANFLAAVSAQLTQGGFPAEWGRA
jgi:N-acetylmuramoyl-L-alanine amidase